MRKEPSSTVIYLYVCLLIGTIKCMRIAISRGEIIVALIIGALFILSSYYTNMYSENIQALIGVYDAWGMLIYVLVTIVAIVIAPVSAMPLIPIAVTMWGSLVGGILSIIGWSIGAVIAFYIARRFGYRFVGKFVKLRKVQTYADKVNKSHFFWTVVLLRMVLPVDVLSYALGLFSKMSLGAYTLATIIGISPFALIFSYVADMPILVQICALAFAGILIFFGYERVRDDITQSEPAEEK